MPRFLLLLCLCLLYLRGAPAGAARPTLYELLGVPRDASQKDLKRAYHRLALELHPDKQDKPDNKDAMTPEEEEKLEEVVRRFIEVVAAYEVLSDPARRKRYDTLGDDGIHRGGGGGGGAGGGRRGSRAERKLYSDDPFHMYSRFPGGAFEFHWTGKKPRKMQDVQRNVDLTLEELFSGPTLREVTVHRQRLCHHCHGTGAHSPDAIEACPVCGGSGFAHFLHEHHHEADPYHDHGEYDDENGAGEEEEEEAGGEEAAAAGGGKGHHTHHKHGCLQQLVNTTCPHCAGTGKVVPANATCSVCGGKGTVIEPKTYTFNATHAGQRLRYEDGGQAMGHSDGAVIFVVKAQPHPKFKKGPGADLVYDARVQLVDALVGFEKFVRHLDGRKIPIVHDIVTFHGYTHRVEGEGLPLEPSQQPAGAAAAAAGNVLLARGDLLVHFEVVFPRQLTATQRAALRKVMDEDDVGVLEDVIKLAAATQDARDWEEERKYAWVCPRRKRMPAAAGGGAQGHNEENGAGENEEEAELVCAYRVQDWLAYGGL